MTPLSSNMRFTVTTGAAISACIALIVGTWKVTNAMRDIQEELSGIRRDMNHASLDRWTASDMDRWAAALAIINKDELPTLEVPSPRDSRIRN